MIICYSRNFCLIRVPKSASTTVAGAIIDSGMLNPETDFCSNSIEFESGGLFNNSVGVYHNACLSESVVNLLQNKDRTHHTVSQYMELGLIQDDMEVFSTIRHPVERFLSFVKFLYKDPDPNTAWQHWKECLHTGMLNTEPLKFVSQNMFNRLFKPQHWWFGTHAILWPVEYLDHCLKDFMQAQGKSFSPLHHRTASTEIKNTLSHQHQQQILDLYQDDFVMWEKAFTDRTALVVSKS